MFSKLFALLALLTASGCASGPASEIPAHWFLTGSAPNDYRVGRTETASGAAARLAARTDAPSGFGTLAQVVDAEPYRERRVRLSAEVEVEGVAQRAALWLRVDGADEILAFDNMEGRSVSGTRAAQRYAVVLDVPVEAQRLAYGLLLRGGGAVTVDHVALETVDRDVEPTDQLVRPLSVIQPPVTHLLPAPTNLNFED